MAHWRIDASCLDLSCKQITPYNAYFENLENWVITETDINRLKEVYEILTRQIYKSLFLDTLAGQAKKGELNWNDIKSRLLNDLNDFDRLLDNTIDIWNVNEKPVSCSICQESEILYLDYSACQEYIIKTWIFYKILKLNGNVDDLIDIEKQCLKSWIYFLIAQPQHWNPDDENSDDENSDDESGWDGYVLTDDPSLEDGDEPVHDSNKLLEVGVLPRYRDAKDHIDILLPIGIHLGRRHCALSSSHLLDQMDSGKWTDILKLETEEKGVNKLKALYNSAQDFIKNMNLNLCDIIKNGKYGSLPAVRKENGGWDEVKLTEVIDECFGGWDDNVFKWDIEDVIMTYQGKKKEDIIEIIRNWIKKNKKIDTDYYPYVSIMFSEAIFGD